MRGSCISRWICFYPTGITLTFPPSQSRSEQCREFNVMKGSSGTQNLVATLSLPDDFDMSAMIGVVSVAIIYTHEPSSTLVEHKPSPTPVDHKPSSTPGNHSKL